jgi:SAM-dependent methyltransferase
MSDAPWYRPWLACPDCGAELAGSQPPSCTACGFSAPTSKDLRPRQPAPCQMALPRTLGLDLREALERLDTLRPKVSYRGPQAKRDSREFISEIEHRLNPPARVLDLGCGPRDQSVPFQHLGHQYVGVDYTNPAADLLADAHALPFAAGAFHCVFSFAVFEHLHNPFVAITEVERVLQPGGLFLGAVSQGEPFHDSFFHHTAWGILALLQHAPSLRLVKLWDSMDTLASLARMGRYPRVLKTLLSGLAAADRHLPYLAPRRRRWSASELRMDRLYRAGSLCFVITKANP